MAKLFRKFALQIMKRLIGEYGEYNSGTLFIVLAGIHGNEKAGIFALERIFEYFAINRIQFKGKLVALKCNLTALELNQRFIHKDLNRQWYDTKIKKLSALPFGMLNTAEDREQVQLLDYIQYVLSQQDDKDDIVMIDLHTTSAAGACMTITNQHSKSVDYARMLPVPVISGMTKVLEGTTLEYFENMGIPGIAYEAGQHDDIESIERMKYGLVSLFLNAEILDEKHSIFFAAGIERLRKYNEGLPYVVDVLYHHAIIEEDEFIMRQGYSNFSNIAKGEHLADDKKGAILAPNNGMILMPLYQKKGSDGFFIVEKAS